jgi:hypothetical protein
MIESIERIEMNEDGVIIIKESLEDPIVREAIMRGLSTATLLR